MDYESKYKNALEWASGIYPNAVGADKEDLEHYFPELARKQIKEEKSTWSEEDKTNKLSEEDIKNLNRTSMILYEAGQVQNWWKEERLIPKEESDYLCNWLKSIKQRLGGGK